MNDEPLWTTEQLAEYLSVPISTIGQWAYLGKGPPFYKLGRYRRYRREDVEAWMNDATAQYQQRKRAPE